MSEHEVQVAILATEVKMLKELAHKQVETNAALVAELAETNKQFSVFSAHMQAELDKYVFGVRVGMAVVAAISAAVTYIITLLPKIKGL